MFGFWACVMLLAFLPATFFRSMLGIGSIWGAVLFVLLLFLGFGLTELVLLLLQNGYDSLQKHFRAADLMLGRLEKWSRAFYLQVDSFGRPDDSLEIDTEINEAFKHTDGISKEESLEAVRDVLNERFDGQTLSVSSPEGFTRKGEIPSSTDIFLERKRENHKKGQREAQLQRERRQGIQGIRLDKDKNSGRV